MNKLKCGRKFLLLLAFCLTLLLCVLSVPFSVKADAAGAYDFEITQYAVEMTVSENREVQVTERITAYFSGYDSHGIIRDFALGDGVRYRDIDAKCDSADFSPYVQNDSSSFLSLYLRGEGRTQGQTRTYTVTYTMIVPALSEEGYLPLNLIGYGWQTTISDVTVTLTLPEGLSSYAVYSGAKGTTGNECGAAVVRDGNTVTVTAETLGYENGITLDLSFSAGVLTTSFDKSILIALVLGVVLLAAAILIRLLVCRQPDMVTSVNLTAPDEMDPLKMGKLVDNKVDSEDLGALVFWFADQGYLTIDMTENSKDPVITKTGKEPAEDMPAHVRVVYEGLFRNRESLRISSLNNSFYTTSSQAKTLVNATVSPLYQKKSAFCIGLLAVLAIALLGGLAFLYPVLTVYSGYLYWPGFILCAVSFFVAAFGTNVAKQRERKWKKLKLLVPLGCFILSLVPCLITLLLPNPAFGKITPILLVLFASLTGLLSGGLLCRTEEYSRQLGHILGFKQFIEFTERDKIEFMLKENPELYYHILPYAQVLGVTDAWTNKFKGLDMKAPAYVRYDTTSFVIDCMVWHALFRSMNGNFARNMVSRPSSSGKAGGHGGGFGGGFGGGGFGGGGGRGC